MGDVEHDRVRTSYDVVADDYLVRFHDELGRKPLDRALLQVVVEEAGVGRPIADLGCGPGHVAGWLAALGARVVGIDLSPGMVATGRRTFPEVEFRVGDLVSLPVGDEELGAVVALYSIIHLAPDELRPAFAEVRRCVHPSAPFLVSFHVGDEVRHLAEWLGHPVDVDFRFFDTGSVTSALETAGFAVQAVLERASYPDEVDTRRAYVLSRRR